MKFNGLVIGIPKEIMEGEKRVAATPETAGKMIKEGALVLVEKGAGEGSYFPNEDYEKQGAQIIENVCKLYAESDIILKVKEPLFNQEVGLHEADMMKKGQYLITFLHPASPANHSVVRQLATKGITALTLDGVPRISRAQAMDALTSMSTVAGYKSVLMAANRLPKFMPMIGTAIGMIQPSVVLVIGSGVAGLQAIATAKRLGAIVNAADIRPDAREQAKSLGAKVVDLGIPPEVAIGEGGYALHLTEEWLLKERKALGEIVSHSDIIILSALVPGKIAPILVTEDMVQNMKTGSVIVDIAIDQGGNCEITEPGKVVEKIGVLIDGTKNIPGMLPSSSTWMFSNNIYNFLSNLVQESSVKDASNQDGKIVIDTEDEIIASSLVTYQGEVVHAGALEAMKMLTRRDGK
ncbi:MAG TPA: NAD(P)(+) transhydrogenase (Re/Si-specific) subunit alpha [Firmicutes bacterium]|jgi:NAD(P) transhydrogenase subunit alpha|nr:NAD(P)(+) transhydrogenase (Re/Si-specific) subunit alpha [Bacillota bacterium]HBT16756.1 NAD(P)(+) transhydrogenase (Re/Si-specific) subunit alpha [Bacillota bacterium]